MSSPQFIPFNVKPAKSDIQQMYVTKADHVWIKEQSLDNNVRMTAVVSALIEHAQQSEEVFKHLYDLVLKIDAALPEDFELPTELNQALDDLIEQYGRLGV